MIRIVLDTSVLISALLFAGNPRILIDLALHKKIAIVSSIEMINELRRF